jgi:hypothetical protein
MNLYYLLYPLLLYPYLISYLTLALYLPVVVTNNMDLYKPTTSGNILSNYSGLTLIFIYYYIIFIKYYLTYYTTF